MIFEFQKEDIVGVLSLEIFIGLLTYESRSPIVNHLISSAELSGVLSPFVN